MCFREEKSSLRSVLLKESVLTWAVSDEKGKQSTKYIKMARGGEFFLCGQTN